MENKLRKKSINSIIYLLLAGMLITVVFVSIYTVASKRRGAVEGVDSSTDTSTNANSPVDSVESSNPADTDGEKSKDKADDTTDASAIDTNEEATEVGGIPTLPATEDDEKPADLNSVDKHYFIAPVSGELMKNFEVDIPVWSLTMNDYRAHTGVDIAAEIGNEVLSASSGTVCKVYNDPMMGRCVVIDHGDDIYTSYMNLSAEEDSIPVGSKVSMGAAIGSVGESALIEIAEEPHLHFEMKIGGKYVNPLDYMEIREGDLEYEG